MQKPICSPPINPFSFVFYFYVVPLKRRNNRTTEKYNKGEPLSPQEFVSRPRVLEAVSKTLNHKRFLLSPGLSPEKYRAEGWLIRPSLLPPPKGKSMLLGG